MGERPIESTRSSREVHRDCGEPSGATRTTSAPPPVAMAGNGNTMLVWPTPGCACAVTVPPPVTVVTVVGGVTDAGGTRNGVAGNAIYLPMDAA